MKGTVADLPLIGERWGGRGVAKMWRLGWTGGRVASARQGVDTIESRYHTVRRGDTDEHAISRNNYPLGRMTRNGGGKFSATSE